MSEVLLALKEARETLDRLLAQYPTGFTARRFELNKDLKQSDNMTVHEFGYQIFNMFQHGLSFFVDFFHKIHYCTSSV